MLRPFDTATVMALRGYVDLYYWKGIPVARSWPKSPSTRTVSAAEQLTRSRMSAVAAMTGAIDPKVRADYQMNLRLGTGKGVTWVDNFRSVAMGGRAWYV